MKEYITLNLSLCRKVQAGASSSRYATRPFDGAAVCESTPGSVKWIIPAASKRDLRACKFVYQVTTEEGGDAGERILPRGGIGSLDRDDAGGGAKIRRFVACHVGPIEIMISAGIDLYLDLCTARYRAVEKLLARRRRGPDILGAE
jgi:hypothetical protein